MEDIFIWTLFFLLIFFGVAPMILMIVGAFQMKKDSPKAKKMFIIAGIWLLIGAGSCGLVIGVF